MEKGVVLKKRSNHEYKIGFLGDVGGKTNAFQDRLELHWLLHKIVLQNITIYGSQHPIS